MQGKPAFKSRGFGILGHMVFACGAKKNVRDAIESCEGVAMASSEVMDKPEM